MNIATDIEYIGNDDLEIDLFEGQYKVPNGISYNSYIIRDEKTAVLDTVDARFTSVWLKNIEKTLGSGTVDYLVIHHAEPDHSGSVAAFVKKYPNAKVVTSVMAFNMLKAFTGIDLKQNGVTVTENSELVLGAHTLTFFTAPMVHWPEVLVSYDRKNKILFSADAFGRFGANSITYKLSEEQRLSDIRRYYFGIVGKFGAAAATLLKKAATLDISMVCPLHGPVLSGDEMTNIVGLYNIWTAYGAESAGTVVAYASVYGHTETAAKYLARKLEAKGEKVVMLDLARAERSAAVEAAFRYGKLALLSVTYCGGVFPAMRDFLIDITEREYQNRTVAIVENGAWAPAAAKTIKSMFENSKNITVIDPTVTIKCAPSPQNYDELDALAEAIAEK